MIDLTLYIFNCDDVKRLVGIAKLADAAGFRGVAFGEHISLGSDLSSYPYAGGLARSEAAWTPWFEPAVVHGAIAAVTSRVRISNCILLAPLRPAVLLAKQLTTIDHLSGGRSEPCFGVGWSREEYASLDVDFGSRRQILRDNLAACRALWENQPATFQSETVSFSELYQMPQPIQKRIPILLGIKANAKNAALVAELCDGWETGPDDSKSLEKLREGSRIYRDAFVEAGRNPAHLRVRAHLPVVSAGEGMPSDMESTFACVESMQAAGVTDFAVGVQGRSDGVSSMQAIERYVNELAAHAAKI